MTLLSVVGWRWVGWAVGAGLLFAPERGRGQGPAAEMPGTARAVLVEMASRAGVIFTGKVTGIARMDGCVEVRFRVEEAVKGVGRGRAAGYVLREWTGLWTGAERYRVGQSYLMLLTAPGAGGLSAPVDGMDGAMPLVAGGSEPMARGGGDAPADTAGQAAEMRVDLRWLGARSLRSMRAEGMTAYGGAPEVRRFGDGASFLPRVREWLWVGAVAPLVAADGSSGAGMSVSSVVALLRVGGGDVHVAR